MGGYGDLFYLGCLWIFLLTGVCGGGNTYRGFICRLMVICSSFDFRFGMSIELFL